MKRDQKYLGQDGDMLNFLFTCEGCRSEGELQVNVKEAYKPFGCPEGCGATYILWHPEPEQWDLKCVVCPIFSEEF